MHKGKLQTGVRCAALLSFFSFFIFANHASAETITVEQCHTLGGLENVEDCASVRKKSIGNVPSANGQTFYNCCVTEEQYNVLKSSGKLPGNTNVTPTSSENTTPSFTYTPLEKIPGFESETSSAIDFPRYMEILFNILLWSVGIAALFMIIVGGFWYLTAAGNTSQLEQAKEIIRDSIIGLLVAFFSWLLLYVINPDLVRLDLSSLTSLKMNSGYTQYVPSHKSSLSGGGYSGSLSQCPGGSAGSVSMYMAAGATETQANILSCIAVPESSCNASARNPSSTACGTLQFLKSTWAGYASGSCKSFSNCTNAKCNAQTAVNAVRDHGYTDWTCRNCQSKASACIKKYGG